MPIKPADTKAGPSAVSSAQHCLFGQDSNGRFHGASFLGHDEAAVERAADLMDLYCVAADTDPLRDLAAALPTGRLFPNSGKAFVPFIKADLYERLLAATGTGTGTGTGNTSLPMNAASKPADGGGGAGAGQGRSGGGAGASDPPATRAGAKAPANFSEIGIGSFVSAKGDDEGDEGYYAAKVIATKTPDSFVLQWGGYPDLPEFVRARRALGLLPPEAAAGLA